MILTITLNPSIDKTIYLEQFQTGSCNRASNTRSDLGGKGINVSTVLNHLKEDTLCMGFDFRESSIIERTLTSRGLKHKFVTVEGDIRTNIKIFDTAHQLMTEINESGTFVSDSAVAEFLDEVDAFLEYTHILVLSGSIPPGVPTDIYRRLIRMAHQKEVKTVLDASGEAFLLGLEEKPFLIKPNSAEFEQAFKKEIRSGASPIEVAQKLVADGIPYVCISMGSEGALLVDQKHTYLAKPLSVEAKGLAGAGDSMIAGICYAMRKHKTSEDMLRYAMAAAAGSIRKEGTMLAKESDILELLPQVEIEILA